MKKKTFIIIFSLLFAAVIALLVYEASKGALDKNTILRALLLVAGFIASIMKILQGSKATALKQTKIYKEQYKDIIRSAFSKPEEKKQLEKLLLVIKYYNKEDCIAKALAELKKLVPMCKTNDEFCAVYTFYALAYEDLYSFFPAIECYEKVLEYDETRSSIWSNLGRLYEETGNYEKAAASLEKAIYYDSENAFAYHNLASVYYSNGEYDKVIEYDEIALKKNGKLYQAAALLCLVYCQLENPEQSDKYFKIAVANGQSAPALRTAIQRAAIQNVKNDECEENE